jgi:hypothetical protein
VLDTGSNTYTSKYDITDAEHYVEVEFVRSSTDIASDGTCELLIDGVSKEALSGKDNFDRFSDEAEIWLGCCYYLVGAPTGTLYLDVLDGNDTGDEIGA